MKYDSKTIEESGADFVKARLRKVNTLDPNIPYNDKTASWDGNILVYSTVPFTKNKLRAKIPTQVKTRTLSKYKTKYPVSVADLKNYKKDGSILYFLVEIVNDVYKIYYAKLFLLDLERLIVTAENKSKKPQKSIDVCFLEFPESIKDIQILIEDYISEASKQKQLLPEVFDIDTFKKKYPNRSVTFNLRLPPNPTQSDILNSINQQKPYLYYHYDKGISVPVGKFESDVLSIVTEKNIEVKVDQEVLFTSLKVETLSDKHRIKIGSTITIEEGGDSFKLTYNIKNVGIVDTIKTLKFIIAMNEHKPIYLNGNIFFTYSDFNAVIDKIMIKQQLDIYQDIQTLFKRLGIRKDLKVQELSDIEYKNLMMFCQSELYDKEVPLGHPKSNFGFLHIGNIHILCYCRATAKEGYYIIKSIFDKNLLSFALQEGKVPVGSYLYLIQDGIESFRKIDNINYSDLIDSLNVLEPLSIMLDAYNQLLLIMLSYYDEEKYERTLVACLWLAQYLWEKSGKDFNYINLCQVKYRLGKLLQSDKQQLVKIKSLTDSTAIKLACSIMLQSFDECDVYYSQLSKEEQEVFDTYPIRHIWGRK